MATSDAFVRRSQGPHKSGLDQRHEEDTVGTH